VNRSFHHTNFVTTHHKVIFNAGCKASLSNKIRQDLLFEMGYPFLYQYISGVWDNVLINADYRPTSAPNLIFWLTPLDASGSSLLFGSNTWFVVTDRVLWVVPHRYALPSSLGTTCGIG
jgi:hypothetical protein